MKNIIIALLFVFSVSLTAQDIAKVKDSLEVHLDIDTRAYLFDTNLPFWMVANTFGGVGNRTQGYAAATTKIEYSLNERALITGGLSVFYRDGVATQLQRNEMYVQYERPAWRFVVGSKNPDTRETSLSTTNENIILSGNTRSLPGLLLETTKPFKIADKLFIDAGIGHYELNDEQRFVENTKVHYKRFYALYNLNDKHSFKSGIQHFAQWSGVSPSLGKQPNGLSDFARIFVASRADDSAFIGDQANALGNHLGSIDAYYKYVGEMGIFNAYHLHLFDDGSGTRFANFPDGVWGVKYQFNNYHNLTINYEYIDTQNQSGSSGRSARDNYFSNSIYRSGWTYEEGIIGLPFFELNQETGRGISNNRVVAHHIAASVQPTPRLSLLGKLTYLIRKGTYAVPIIPNEKSILAYGAVNYETVVGLISFRWGYDVSHLDRDNWALSLGYKYILN